MRHGSLLAIVCSIWVGSELLVMVLKHTRGNASRRDRGSLWLLYVRSHWLRMPPHRLIVHLTRKALRRSRESTVDV